MYLVLYGSILIRVIDFEFVKLLEILEFLVSFIWFFIWKWRLEIMYFNNGFIFKVVV